MPIYEYRCDSCKRKVSLFFPSFSAAEGRTAAGENRCPRCGSAELNRVMSRPNTLKSDSMDDSGGDFADAASNEAIMEGLDDNDPRAVARWARRMKESLGEDLDMGPEFDQALARIESGEDPERVMEDIDPEALAMGAGGEGDADFDE